MTHHKHLKPWWDQVSKIEIDNFPDREEAKKAERQAIIAEAPAHNKHIAIGNKKEMQKKLAKDWTKEKKFILRLIGENEQLARRFFPEQVSRILSGE